MNLFLIKNDKKNYLIGTTIQNEGELITTKQHKQQVIFMNSDQEIVGFNLLDTSGFACQEPGRILMTEEVSQYLQKAVGAKFPVTNYFVVGKVVGCEKIEGTHLSQCQVDVGQETLQIVCGASNVRTNILVVVALVGAVMNDGTLIKPGKLRGIDSFGMLCSCRELNLTNQGFNEEGIIELPTHEFTVGEVFKILYSNGKK